MKPIIFLPEAEEEMKGGEQYWDGLQKYKG